MFFECSHFDVFLTSKKVGSKQERGSKSGSRVETSIPRTCQRAHSGRNGRAERRAITSFERRKGPGRGGHPVELNSRFKVTIFSFSRLRRPFRFTLKFPLEIFTPHGSFPPWSGFGIRNLLLTTFLYHLLLAKICSSLWRQHLFRIDSSRMDFRCVHLFQFLNVCNQNISFPNSSHIS